MDTQTAVDMGAYLHALNGNLHATVATAWCLAEGGNAEGLSNALNLRNEPDGDPYLWTARYMGRNGSDGFEQFPNWQEGLAAATQNYRALGMDFAAGQTDAEQLAIIYQSPWDAGRYGGDGHTLVGAYNRLYGSGTVPPPSGNDPFSDPPPAPPSATSSTGLAGTGVHGYHIGAGLLVALALIVAFVLEDD